MTTKTKFTVGEYTMRNGQPAKVFMVCPKTKILLGAFRVGPGSAGGLGSEGVWEVTTWMPSGANNQHKLYSIMPPLREWWIYKDNIFDTIESAERFRDSALSGTNTRIIHVREVRDDQA